MHKNKTFAISFEMSKLEPVRYPPLTCTYTIYITCALANTKDTIQLGEKNTDWLKENNKYKKE